MSATFRARNHVERVVKIVLFACACVAVLTTIGIVFSVLFETVRFFEKVSPIDFLFGLHWSPQTAIRADQVGSSGAFGIVPLVTGTLLITMIAMLIAGPIGLFAAIYMAEYATPRFRALRQAGPRDPRRHSDRRARLLRGADAWRPGSASSGRRSGSTSPPRARSPPAWSWA